MAWSIFEGGMWRLIQQSDTTSCCVLLVLFSLSVVCWALFLYKLILFRTKKRHFDSVLHEIKGTTNEADLRMIALKHKGTFAGYFVSQILQEYDVYKSGRNHERGSFSDIVSDIIDEAVQMQESYVSVLSTSAAVAPLLGLFGTIWGLIQSFLAISEQQNADIVTVAPGIAQALITTLAGLLVAIPALGMVAYIHACITGTENQLVRMARRVLVIITVNGDQK